MTMMTIMTDDGSSGKDDINNNNNSRVCRLFTIKLYYETILLTV
jgi:hypothetical protein